MKKKVGICTLYTGYNCGSSLQAFSLKHNIENLGYKANILKVSGSLIKGRDFRLKKLLIIIFRSLLYSKNMINVVKSYLYNNKGNFSSKTINEFDTFSSKYLTPTVYSYSNLKELAKKNDYVKFVCGSDQIWNSTTYYVDPFYYLRFCSQDKKIAYAPSFGRDYIAKYNKNILKKYISQIKYLSVREESAVKIVSDLIEKKPEHCLDPSFLTNKEEWKKCFNLNKKMINEEYIFAYFLNKPSDKALELLNKIKNQTKNKVVFLNMKEDGFDTISGGPVTFLNCLFNAKCIFTDSFHGVCFSINFNKEFYVFDRNYISENQSTRITSILNIFDLNSRFNSNSIQDNINYKKVNNKLTMEVDRSLNWLKNSLEG